MALFKYEGVIFVEADDTRDADRKLAEAFMACAGDGDEVEIPHLHAWTRIRKKVVAVQVCCGAMVPNHAVDCTHDGVNADLEKIPAAAFRAA